MFLIDTIEDGLFLLHTYTFRLTDKLELPFMDASKMILQLAHDSITNAVELGRLEEAVLVVRKDGEFASQVVQRHYFFALEFGNVVE